MLYRDEGELPPEAAQLIREMTQDAATDRIALLDIAKHPWVVGGAETGDIDTQVV